MLWRRRPIVVRVKPDSAGRKVFTERRLAEGLVLTVWGGAGLATVIVALFDEVADFRAPVVVVLLVFLLLATFFLAIGLKLLSQRLTLTFDAQSKTIILKISRLFGTRIEEIAYDRVRLRIHKCASWLFNPRLRGWTLAVNLPGHQILLAAGSDYEEITRAADEFGKAVGLEPRRSAEVIERLIW